MNLIDNYYLFLKKLKEILKNNNIDMIKEDNLLIESDFEFIVKNEINIFNSVVENEIENITNEIKKEIEQEIYEEIYVEILSEIKKEIYGDIFNKIYSKEIENEILRDVLKSVLGDEIVDIGRIEQNIYIFKEIFFIYKDYFSKYFMQKLNKEIKKFINPKITIPNTFFKKLFFKNYPKIITYLKIEKTLDKNDDFSLIILFYCIILEEELKKLFFDRIKNNIEKFVFLSEKYIPNNDKFNLFITNFINKPATFGSSLIAYEYVLRLYNKINFNEDLNTLGKIIPFPILFEFSQNTIFQSLHNIRKNFRNLVAHNSSIFMKYQKFENFNYFLFSTESLNNWFNLKSVLTDFIIRSHNKNAINLMGGLFIRRVVQFEEIENFFI